MPASVISSNPHVQAHYEQCLKNGCSPKLAEALAFQQGPAMRTDATFMQGECNGKQFAKDPATGNRLKKIAKKAGVSVVGKKYMSSLARFPGDPEAWVSSRGEVEKVVRKRGWGCTGSVNVQARQDEPLKQKGVTRGVADHIIEAEVESIVAETPEIAPTPKEKLDLKEKILSTRKPHWAK